jgi:hypothetical protein
MKLANAAKAPVEQSNRLPILAIRINAAHAAVNLHIKTTINEMMAAGDDLREAKKLAGHGNWLTWLKANCPDVSERTAHLYMQLAKWRTVVEDAMVKSAWLRISSVISLEFRRVLRSGLSVWRTRSQQSMTPNITKMS